MIYPYRKLIKPPLGSRPYKGHKLSEGLVGYWLMNEGTGNKVFDLSGNRWIGTFAAGAASPFWLPSKFGSALSFDGGDYVDMNDNPESGLITFTFSAWVYVRSFTNNPYIYGNAAALVNDGIFYIFLRASPAGTVDFSYSDGSSYIDTTNDGNVLSVNTWHHIAIVNNGSNITRYLDGVQTGTINAHSVGAVKTWSESYFGNINYEGDAGPQTGRFLDGLIDHVIMYNCPLSASEIALLYREPFCMFKDPDEIAILGGYTAVGGIPILRRRRVG